MGLLLFRNTQEVFDWLIGPPDIHMRDQLTKHLIASKMPYFGNTKIDFVFSSFCATLMNANIDPRIH